MIRKQLIRIAQSQVALRSLKNQAYKTIVYRQFAAFSSSPQQYEFKAETKKLLDIVAKSLYTDKDVFIRELLSNASDALEKQRFLSAQSQQNQSDGSDLQISIKLDEGKRVISIIDTGVGMTKEEMIENLGTIARSGSKQFLQENKDAAISDKIIGQFGVGFYSAFIVADTVEVTSKKESSGTAYKWSSDGTGHFQIEESEDAGIERGTRIDIFLKPDCAQFARRSEIEKVIQRYSNFISFPISLNDVKLNLVQAMWTRGKNDISLEEHQQFYEYITQSTRNYKYKLHYQTDAPISIKALIYVPSQHDEKFGFSQEDMQIHLYSRKVLIKRGCRELLPNYLRFIKGVVDCEDIPLNISRENYQDSALIAKLRGILTQRILKEIDSEAQKDPQGYLRWYDEFQYFLKEGVASDPSYANQIMPLLRFQHNQDDGFISLEDYIKKMQPGQTNIYFLLASSREIALNSPYIDNLKGSNVQVLFTYVHIDEMVFRSVDKYKDFKFINVETNPEELAKNVKEVQHDTVKGLPAEDIAPFSLWLKNELAPNITAVKISKRLTGSPAVVASPLSSGMRQVMGMLDKTQQKMLAQNLTIEINPNHEFIVLLNQTRKQNSAVGATVARQLLDNCLLLNGLIDDSQAYIKRSQQIMELLMGFSFRHPQVENTQVNNDQKPTKGVAEEVILDEHGNPKSN